jgi:hypothetical protein
MMVMTFLLINILVWVSSLYLSHAIHRDDRTSVVLLTSFLVYFSQITLTVLFLGVVIGRLNAQSLLLTNVVLSSVALLATRKQWLSPFRRICSGLKSAYAGCDFFSRGLAVVFLAALLLLLAKIWFLPPYVWDVMMYHLTPAVEWYQQGRIPLVLNHAMVNMNLQALGMTVLNFWFFVFLGNDLLIGLPQTVFAIMLALTSYAFLRETTKDISLSIKFSVVTFFIPFVLMQADTAKDHVALSTCLFAGAFFLWKVLDSGRSTYFVPAGLAFGLMSGLKVGAVVGFVIAAMFFLVFAVMHSRKGQLKILDARKRVALSLVVSVALIALLSGYWHAREILAHSTAVAVEKHVEATVISGQQEQKADTFTLLPGIISYYLSLGGIANTRSNITEFFPRIFDYQGDYTPDLIEISGYGPQFAAFGLPALIYLLGVLFRRRMLEDNVNLLPVVAITLFIFYVPFYFNPNSYRLLSFFPFIMIPFGGYLLHKHCLYTGRVRKALINGAVLVSCLWSVSTTAFSLRQTSILALKEFISLPQEYRTSARYTGFSVSHTPSYRLFLENLPPDEPIAYLYDGPLFAELDVLALGVVWTYPFFDPSWKRKLLYLSLKNYLSCEKFVCNPLPQLNDFLEKQKVSLLTTCAVNKCVMIRDQQYVELVRGLYFYRGGDGRE